MKSYIRQTISLFVLFSLCIFIVIGISQPAYAEENDPPLVFDCGDKIVITSWDETVIKLTSGGRIADVHLSEYTSGTFRIVSFTEDSVTIVAERDNDQDSLIIEDANGRKYWITVKTYIFKDLTGEVYITEDTTKTFTYTLRDVNRFSKVTVSDSTIVKPSLYYRYSVQWGSINEISFTGLKPGRVTATIIDHDGIKHKVVLIVTPTDEPIAVDASDSETLTVGYTKSFSTTGKAKINTVDSSDSNVATIQSVTTKGFTVNALNPGETIITVTSTNGTTYVFMMKINPKEVVSLYCGNRLIIDTPIEFTEYVNSEVDLSSAISMDTSIVQCRSYSRCIDFEPKKEGTTTVEITGKNGTRDTITVIVKYTPTDYGFDFNCSDTISLGLSNWKTIEGDWFCDISSIRSEKPGIVKIENHYNYFMIKGVKPGKTRIFIEGYDSNYNSAYAMFYVVVRVKKSDLYNLTEFSPYEDDIPYGTSIIKCKTSKSLKGMKVTFRIQCKSKRISKTGTIKSNGKCSVRIPVGKIGKKSKVTLSYNGMAVTHNVKIASNTTISDLTPYTHHRSKVVKYVVKRAHKGDVVTLKIGKKKYTKKIKNDVKRLVLRFKIKPPKKYGIKKKVVVKNKYKQILDSDSDYIYYGGALRRGQTRRMVKWSMYWGEPDIIRHYRDGTEQWCYHTDWTYVYFRRGRVVGWQD